MGDWRVIVEMGKPDPVDGKPLGVLPPPVRMNAKLIDQPLEDTMTLEAWVQEVLGELRKCAFGSDEYHTGAEPHLAVELVELDGPQPAAAIVLTFRNLKRSAHGLYGYRWDNLPYWFELDADSPEAQAHTIWANFQEAAVKTPEHPGSGEIVWID